MKKSSANNSAVADCKFLVTYADGSVIGNNNGYYTSDENGFILIDDQYLEVGKTVVVREVEAAPGFALDATPQQVTIKANTSHVLTFYNAPLGSLQVVKKNSATGGGVANCKFLITYSDGSVVGSGNGYYTTDEKGIILVADESLEIGKTVIVREV